MARLRAPSPGDVTMPHTEQPTLDAIGLCCARIDAMCADLDADRWHAPTACPGWNVQDVVAHLGSLEALLLGHEEPFHEPPHVAYVHNELGALNERLVDRRRSWTGEQVLDEFREMSGLRLEALASLPQEELETLVPAPTGGVVPLRRFLGIRLWDYVVHEMDIAEALDNPHDLENPGPRRVLDELLLLLPRAAARGGLGEGRLLSLEVLPPLPRVLHVRVEGGGGVVADDPAEASGPAGGEAALHLRASPTVLLRVGMGRRPAEAAIQAGDPAVRGDAGLGASILRALNVVP